MRVHSSNWLIIKPAGLYCVPGRFYIDPQRPVNAALITHGHADHAYTGHQKVLATTETLAIMQVRYGNQFAAHSQAIQYYESVNIQGVKILFLPAGHILGSAQILLEYKKERILISGDYKRREDPTCVPFMPHACDVFITEATFGLPVFIHPPIQQEINKLLDSLKNYSERCHLIGAYALGKCQRIIMTLRQLGYDKPIYLHGAMYKLCMLYQTLGLNLGDLVLVNTDNAAQLAGEIVICPPSALHDRWSRRFPYPIKIFASGWMKIRARAKQKGIELPLVISDHADWEELTDTIRQINAPTVLVTHGSEEGLVYYANSHGYKAHALNLLLHEDSED